MKHLVHDHEAIRGKPLYLSPGLFLPRFKGEGESATAPLRCRWDLSVTDATDPIVFSARGKSEAQLKVSLQGLAIRSHQGHLTPQDSGQQQALWADPSAC